MSALQELADQGHRKVRLPIWNEYAYLEVPVDGPWCYLYDLTAGVGGGDPIPILFTECARENRWEPVAPSSAGRLLAGEDKP